MYDMMYYSYDIVRKDVNEIRDESTLLKLPMQSIVSPRHAYDRTYNSRIISMLLQALSKRKQVSSTPGAATSMKDGKKKKITKPTHDAWTYVVRIKIITLMLLAMLHCWWHQAPCTVTTLGDRVIVAHDHVTFSSYRCICKMKDLLE